VQAAKHVLNRTPLAAGRVIAVSDFVARRQEEIAGMPAKRITRVWNALQSVSWLPRDEARTALGLPEGRRVIGCLCRASPGKGVAHLLAAFATVLRRTAGTGNRPLLVYMGDGPDMENIRYLVHHLALTKDVVLAGFRRDARDLLPAFDVCVVPSVVEEAFGLTALEAMTAGVPVVATSVGGIPELVEHGVTGLLVPPADEDALARSICAILDSPDRARILAVTAGERAQSLFGMDRVVDGIVGVLQAGFSSAPNPKSTLQNSQRRLSV
jgi:glycosyltransferase involved in cell wall biosynthesis